MENFSGLGTCTNAIPKFLCSSAILRQLFHTTFKDSLNFISCNQRKIFSFWRDSLVLAQAKMQFLVFFGLVIFCSLFHTICKYLLAFISCNVNFYFCSRQHAKRKNFHQKPTGMIATRKKILTGHFKLASRHNLTYWWRNRKLAEETRYKKPYFQVKTEHVLDWPEFIVCCEVC